MSGGRVHRRTSSNGSLKQRRVVLEGQVARESAVAPTIVNQRHAIL